MIAIKMRPISRLSPRQRGYACCSDGITVGILNVSMAASALESGQLLPRVTRGRCARLLWIKQHAGAGNELLPV